MVNEPMLRLSSDLIMAKELLLLMRGTLVLLTVAIPKNFELHVTCHLMCQIVKAAEEADDAHEFITNLANDGKPKLVRKEPNYMMSENCCYC
ncbi:hypothetical protein HZH68_016235 [Vespula germanica]|uniref:Uncharacterized protein n=1 Tax=Vespula germanica TaxID=30212 RepID=A0A834MPI3_VESGE|nr:hypothetical protein HZH68_016235 [Vespula germanica]